MMSIRVWFYVRSHLNKCAAGFQPVIRPVENRSHMGLTGDFQRAVRRLCLLLPAVFTASCARVDHAEDWKQATSEFNRASRAEARWSSDEMESSASVSSGETISLDLAVDQALNQNRELRAELEGIAQAKADLVQAGLLGNPLLSLLVRFPEGGGRANLDFGLSQDFAELWLIPGRKLAAQRALQQRILAFVDLAIELVAEIKTVVYSLSYFEAAVALQQQNVVILRQAVTLAEARRQAGDVSALDVNLARSRLTESQVETLVLQRDQEDARRKLLRLMGQAGASTDWTIQADAMSVPSVLPGEQELVELALERRLDARAAWWGLEAAVAEVEQERLKMLPSLAIGISGERPERRGTPSRDIAADTVRSSFAAGELTAPDIQSRAERRRERRAEINFILGPSFEVPLPIFDQNQAQLAKAQSHARELFHRYEELQQRIVESVRTALMEWKLAEERVELLHRTLVPQLEQNLEFAEQSYRAGEENILIVLLAQEALIRGRMSALSAERDRSLSLVNLERRLGGRLPGDEPASSIQVVCGSERSTRAANE